MVVCGDDALAERLAAELTTVYRERVILVVPQDRRVGPAGRARASALLGVDAPVRPRADVQEVARTPLVYDAGHSYFFSRRGGRRACP